MVSHRDKIVEDDGEVESAGVGRGVEQARNILEQDNFRARPLVADDVANGDPELTLLSFMPSSPEIVRATE